MLIPVKAKFTSSCHECQRPIIEGDEAVWHPENHWMFHPECAPDLDPLIESPKSGRFSASTDGYRRGGSK